VERRTTRHISARKSIKPDYPTRNSHPHLFVQAAYSLYRCFLWSYSYNRHPIPTPRVFLFFDIRSRNLSPLQPRYNTLPRYNILICPPRSILPPKFKLGLLQCMKRSRGIPPRHKNSFPPPPSRSILPIRARTRSILPPSYQHQMPSQYILPLRFTANPPTLTGRAATSAPSPTGTTHLHHYHSQVGYPPRRNP
jgi:hypothetical protein